MMTEIIPLRFAGATRMPRLRELTGRDEFAVSGADTANAINLLSSLMESPPQSETGQLRVVDLVAADRDLLLAAVYKRAFGDKIESTLTCARCAQPFDLYFSLRRLIEAAYAQTDEHALKPLGEGRFETSDGARLRLPTGEDELVLTGMGATEADTLLLERCVADSDWSEDRAAFEEFLERVAPLVHLELMACCAECNHAHTVQFDIQSYVLGAIMAERPRLLSEIHRIAKAYSWSLDEILSLNRSDRRRVVELIESEAS